MTRRAVHARMLISLPKLPPLSARRSARDMNGSRDKSLIQKTTLAPLARPALPAGISYATLVTPGECLASTGRPFFLVTLRGRLSGHRQESVLGFYFVFGGSM